MNHLQEVNFEYKDIKLTLKPTQRALYTTLREAKLGNRLNELIKELDNINFDVIYILFKNLLVEKKSLDELLDMNIPINVLVQPLAECLKMLTDSSEKK